MSWLTRCNFVYDDACHGPMSTTGISRDDYHFPMHTMDKLKKAVASQSSILSFFSVYAADPSVLMAYCSYKEVDSHRFLAKVSFANGSLGAAFSATSLQDQLSMLEGLYLLVARHCKGFSIFW
ncbi:hypothetical protein MKW98_008429 [Papaver atlanticum]|uniref:Uncharacterized protein n=1 Tax=Papaver atlanticum TaxID=357466 RepID=A0AAD4SHJ3_9MAGN|nr:hypothetical protein MKW98_008429 [Papaver atlanticum]